MTPRLKDLIAEHRVILYCIDGCTIDEVHNNMLSAQKLINQQSKCKYIAGYRIEKIENIGSKINLR